MITNKQKRTGYLLAALLAAGSTAQAAQYSSSQIPIPTSSSLGRFELDDIYPFESGAYFRGTKQTSRSGVGTYTLEASNKASNVDMNGATKTLTWWADGTHAFTVKAGIWDLNFRGTTIGTKAGLATPGNGCKSPGSCSNTVSVNGTGITGSAADLAWLRNSDRALYDALTRSTANRNLFTATLTGFDLFGETTASTADDAIAFKWVNASGALTPWADPFSFVFLGGVKTFNFLGSSVDFKTASAIQHTNVPVPGALYLFGSALLLLRRKLLG
ncbi:MAG: hypothetical protein FIA97_01715 [Methylococcaceae bacterium]|nr:hypothetical protein [Methylococcaceae bacterium]